MKQLEVFEGLKGFISEEILDGKDIGLDGSTPLLEWGIVNSMEIARIVSFVYDRFNIEIPSDKITLEYLKDLNSLTDLIMNLKTEG